ncbi:hypothetical protein MHYP_G00264120 [Metynnis hypsauchen]
MDEGLRYLWRGAARSLCHVPVPSSDGFCPHFALDERLPLARVSQEGVGLHRSEVVCFQSDFLFTSFWFQALC